MSETYVRVEQLMETLSDGDDTDALPAGDGGKGSVRKYRYPNAVSEVDALNEFHYHVAIGCLEDFDITCHFYPNKHKVKA